MILAVDPDRIEHTVAANGGNRLGEASIRTYVYRTPLSDHPAQRLELRQDGDAPPILAVKWLDPGTGESIPGPGMVRLVDDFHATHDLLQSIGFVHGQYREHHRSSYRLGEGRLDVMTWPLIPAYLEITGPTEDHVTHVATAAGCDSKSLVDAAPVNQLYSMYGHDLEVIPDLTFCGRPA